MGDAQPASLYHALKPNEIRLLLLRPNPDFSAPIDLNLRTASLDDHQVYKALSYVWGSLEDTSTITVNGQPFQATVNLVSALRYIRHRNVAEVIWIDSICIDQSNIPERNSQVQIMMSKIYKGAREVIAWLGESYDDSDEAMMLLQRWGSALIGAGLQDGKDIWSKFGWTRNDEFVLGFIKGILDPFPERAWTALRNLYERPYFRRLWIFQEWVLAESISVMCGHMRLNGMLFNTQWLFNCLRETIVGSDLLVSLGGPFVLATMQKGEPRQDSHDMLLDLVIWRELFHKSNSMAMRSGRLLQLIGMVACRDCADPRDYLFAVAGLSQYGTHPITVDYSMSLEATQTEFSRSYILRDDLRVFSHAGLGHRVKSDSEDNVPSWAMLWHVSGKDSMELPLLMNTKLFSTGFISDFPACSAHAGRTNTAIILRGLIIDTISEVLEHGSGWQAPQDQRWKELLSPHEERIYIHNKPPLQVYFRTLLGDELSGSRIGQIHTESLTGPRRTSAMDLAVNFLRNYCVNSNDINAEQGRQFEHDLRIWSDIPPSYGYGTFFAREEKPSTEQWTRCLENAHRASREFEQTVKLRNKGRSLFKTEQGFIGTGPLYAEKGDVVCVFRNSYAPCLLRRHRDGHQLVGEAFILGLMDGEAGAYLRDEWRLQDITLY